MSKNALQSLVSIVCAALAGASTTLLVSSPGDTAPEISAPQAAASVGAPGAAGGSADPAAPDRSSAEILAAYVQDFRQDDAARTARSFGVEVTGEGGGTWTVDVTGERTSDDSWGVTLREGWPSEATFVYELDAATLAAIDRGQMNALTAAGKGTPADSSPLETRWMEGAKRFDSNPFSFHFWTRGYPETVPFALEHTRSVHGVSNVAIYYEKGLRTIWSSIAKGERVTNNGQPMVIPFPILVFGIRGKAVGTLGDVRVEVPAGEVLMIPPMTPYVFWNEDEDVRAEAVLVVFGEGA